MEDREEAVMYRDRGLGGGMNAAKAEIDRLDWKRINDALDKHLEKSSRSTSRGINDIENKRLSVPSTSAGEPHDQPADLTKNKCSDEEFDSKESDVSGSDGDDTSWIEWFCSLEGNEFLCEVDDKYIKDNFNICGLSSQVPYYDYALDLILDVESSHHGLFTEEQCKQVDSGAEMLYGLIHARYILTDKGMAEMLEKYKYNDFGRCPRVYCCGQPCLPVGQSDISRSSAVKIFCPKCEDVYYPEAPEALLAIQSPSFPASKSTSPDIRLRKQGQFSQNGKSTLRRFAEGRSCGGSRRKGLTSSLLVVGGPVRISRLWWRELGFDWDRWRGEVKLTT